MGDGSFAHMSVHAGSDAEVSCASYADDAPNLSVDAGRICISVSARARQELTAADVKFASELASATAKYAAECTRIHVAQAHQAARTACDCAYGQASPSVNAGEAA